MGQRNCGVGYISPFNETASGTPSVEYIYDALGRRVAERYENLNSSEWVDRYLVYDGLKLAAEFELDPAGELLRRYIYDGQSSSPAIFIDYTPEFSDDFYAVLTDDRGSVMGLVKDDGTLVEQLYYNSTGLCKSWDPSGGGNWNTHPDNAAYNLGRSEYIPFGYLGMYRDRFTGKYHTHFREYDPLHARWLSEDPAGYADGLNLYNAYMGVNGIDPFGLWDETGMLAEYYGKYGEQGQSYLNDLYNSGGMFAKRDYLWDDWRAEADGTIGIASSWWFGLDDSDETAADQLYDALESTFGGSIVNGLTNLMGHQTQMLAEEFPEEFSGINARQIAQAKANLNAMGDIVQDAALDAGLYLSGIALADNSIDALKASQYSRQVKNAKRLRSIYDAKRFKQATNALKIKVVSKLVKDKEFVADIANAFDGVPLAIKLTEDTYAYRHIGPNGKKLSYWLSPRTYANPNNARKFLALPDDNSANACVRIIIPKDTTVLFGKTAGQANNSIFGSHAIGGGLQIYVPNPKVLKDITVP